MSVAKVIEILAEGASIEAAMEDCAKEAAKSVKNIKSIYMKDVQATVKDGKIKKYRVACKVTFVVD